MGHTEIPLDSLGRRITASLQADPRASWTRIAAVLNEPERTVTRHGKELLESGRVKVVGVSGASGVVIVRARCQVGMTRSVAAGLARRDDTTFVYSTTGRDDCIAELQVDDAHIAGLVLDDLPSTSGIRGVRVDSVSRMYRTVREWRPNILQPSEVAALSRQRQTMYQPDGSAAPEIPAVHRAILRVLRHDARTPTSEIARVVGISENTVRRHLETLEVTHQSRLRVVVDPASLGFAAEAVGFVKVAPRKHDELVKLLLTHPEVRYAAAVGGDGTLFVNFACVDRLSLHRMVTQSEWSRSAKSISLSMVLLATKRSGSPMGIVAPAPYLY